MLFVRAFGAVVHLAIKITVVYFEKNYVLTNISAAC